MNKYGAMLYLWSLSNGMRTLDTKKDVDKRLRRMGKEIDMIMLSKVDMIERTDPNVNSLTVAALEARA